MSIVLGRDGNALGVKARLTRGRILGTLLAIVQDGTAWHDFQVIPIARAARVSPASFYQYFKDPTQAILALHEHLMAQGRPIPEHLSKIVTLISYEITMPRKAKSP